MMLARGQMRRVQATDSDRRVWSMVFSIAETCQRMALNLLDVAKSEDGKLRASLADVDLAAVIKDAVLMLEPAASDREQKIVVTASLDTVRADSELLRRVISNLVDNAVRYSPPRESILVEAKSERGRAVIRVSNKGNPIPVEMREKIFDKYVRLESSEQVSTGRGLGLSFCKIAVEAMGGTIGVEDAAGGRTAFTITL
jgi:signal transduction histidine kinase